MGNCCGVNKNSNKGSVYKGKTAHKSVITSDIHDDFEFGKVLGSGHFGIVRMGTHVNNSSYVAAIKSIDKEKVKKNLNLLRDEVELLLNIDHPYIIRLYDVYEDQKYLHLVTEYCSGGNLFDRLL